MTTYRVSLDELPRRLEKDMKARARRVERAVLKTAQRGMRVVAGNMPVAFRELVDSLHVEKIGGGGARIVADAPHAEPVENGSRPHWPPLAPILAWVKLRGMQGLQSRRTLTRRGMGTTTFDHAKSIAAQLRAMQRVSRNYNAEGAYLPVDAALQVAQAIRAAIGRSGTKPHWYMRKSLPDIEAILDEEVKATLPDKETEGG